LWIKSRAEDKQKFETTATRRDTRNIDSRTTLSGQYIAIILMWCS